MHNIPAKAIGKDLELDFILALLQLRNAALILSLSHVFTSLTGGHR